MEKTPISLRKHIAIFGDTNAGKSTLFNAILGQDVSIVSEISGTTTDPVTRAMELIPYGPVALIDTAGLGDTTDLGKERMKKTKDVLSRTDLVLYVKDVSVDGNTYIDFGKTPKINVYTKCDIATPQRVELVKNLDPDGVFIYEHTEKGLAELKGKMVTVLSSMEKEAETLWAILFHRAEWLFL